MTRIVYLYDVAGWALHHVGQMLSVAFGPDDPFTMRCAEEYYRAPTPTDVLYLSFSGLWRQGFDYRRWAGEVVTTFHDPLEISHFTNRADWHRFPLRRIHPKRFDRISVTSDEMETIFRDRYGVDAYRTPTFPHDAECIRTHVRAPSAPLVQFFSATNVGARMGLGTYYLRLKQPSDYLLDHRGRLSFAQFASIAIRQTRKNIPLLTRLERAIASHPKGAANFLHSRRSFLPRDIYLSELARSDVYVCTSHMEGGPLPVMEAVKAGLAVISTPVGQVEEWVRHGENGFLCRTETDFQRAIATYLQHDDVLRQHQARSVEIGAGKRFDAAAWRAFVLGHPSSPDPLSSALPHAMQPRAART